MPTNPTDTTQQLSEAQQQMIQKIKQVVANNKDYFQHKISSSNKPCQTTLKLPKRTGSTTYTQNFTKFNRSFGTQIINQNLADNINIHITRQSDNILKGSSSYQKQFNKESLLKDAVIRKTSLRITNKNRSNELLKLREKNNCKTQQQHIPRYMITQNNCDFLNWGGHNNTFLMRPLYQPATTEHIFNSQSVYRSQFIKHRVKKIEHVYRGDQQRQISNIMLYNKSSYAHNYQPKTGCKLENFKIPELRLASLKDAPRNTQYKREFLKASARKDNFRWKDKSVEQLQKIVLSL